MRYSLVAASVAGFLGAMTGKGDGVLPAHSSFDRYAAMVDRSPFAVATSVALPAATPDFAKDLYVANAARLAGRDMITLASSADQNFKKYLINGQAVDGFTISRIEWSDRVGATKVTISKDGKFATLTFNQALLAQRAAPKGLPAPEQVPQSVPPVVQDSVGLQTPQASVPPVVTRKPGAPPNVPAADPQRQRQERAEQRRRQKSGSKRPVLPTPPAESGQVDLNARP